MILVDTSVWVEHFRRHSPGLEALLNEEQVWCHPFVIGEIALGTLRRRDQILSLLAELPAAPCATHEEVLSFIEIHHLAGAGIGWVDAHLLCSAAVGRLKVWTFDRRLAAAAARTGVEWEE
jgi:predicted nucleic acid-binding protein